MIIKKKKDPELLKKLEQKGKEMPKLSEPIVDDIFRECLANENTPKSDIISVCLMPNESGFKKSDTPVVFDEKKIEEYRKGIKYMLGQLKAVHDGKVVIPVELTEFAEKYGDYGYWTDNIMPVTELFYLGKATHCSTFFEINMTYHDNKIYTKINMDVTPTFDPDDKNR